MKINTKKHKLRYFLKKAFSLFIILMFLAVMPFSAYSEESEADVRLFDEAGHFTAEEAESLNNLLLNTEKKVGFYVAVLVSDNIGSDKSELGARDYADVYYESKFGIDTDGIIYLINNDTKHDRISTSGQVIDIFTDDRIERMFDFFWDEMVAGDFYAAMVKYCEIVEIYAKSGVPENQYRYDEDIGKTYDWVQGEYEYTEDFDVGSALLVMIFCGLGGLVIGIIIIVTVFMKYKVKPVRGAANYLNKNSVKYHQKSDTFIRQYVTARRIESSSSGGGGGGSSTHRSSGGGTHGGGGRSR